MDYRKTYQLIIYSSVITEIVKILKTKIDLVNLF
jgi:hypothetical protein